VLHEVKPNVYRETYLKICFADLLNPYVSRSGRRDNARLLGVRNALRQPAKTTLPPLNFSLQFAAFYLRFGTGLAHG
jgi:hypothetical protein